jgi:hypothetical protein
MNAKGFLNVTYYILRNDISTRSAELQQQIVGAANILWNYIYFFPLLPVHAVQTSKTTAIENDAL